MFWKVRPACSKGVAMMTAAYASTSLPPCKMSCGLSNDYVKKTGQQPSHAEGAFTLRISSYEFPFLQTTCTSDWISVALDAEIACVASLELPPFILNRLSSVVGNIDTMPAKIGTGSASCSCRADLKHWYQEVGHRIHRDDLPANAFRLLFWL